MIAIHSNRLDELGKISISAYAFSKALKYSLTSCFWLDTLEFMTVYFIFRRIHLPDWAGRRLLTVSGTLSFDICVIIMLRNTAHLDLCLLSKTLFQWQLQLNRSETFHFFTFEFQRKFKVKSFSCKTRIKSEKFAPKSRPRPSLSVLQFQ